MKQLGSLLYLLFCIATAMIGYEKHHNVFWSILDFIFAPLVLIYWLVTHQINITIIKSAFSFFLK